MYIYIYIYYIYIHKNCCLSAVESYQRGEWMCFHLWSDKLFVLKEHLLLIKNKMLEDSYRMGQSHSLLVNLLVN